MNSEFEDSQLGGSADEIPELRSLAREMPLPFHLENATVAELRRRGLFASKPGVRRQVLRAVLSAAAALLLVVGGFFSGIHFRPQARAEKSTFVLLLRESSAFRNAHQEDSLVQEYKAWAREVTSSGIAIRGEKLTDDVHLLHLSQSESQADSETVAGFFLVDASDLQQALQIASGCPHVRHGGTIEVRKIDPV